MLVLQVGGGPDLGEKPLGADDGGELRFEDLDGDPAIVLEVLGGHAAGAELALDAVAVGEGEAETIEGGGQGPAITRDPWRQVARLSGA